MGHHKSFLDVAEWVAAQCPILEVEVGSRAHGIAIEGTDDSDRMGVCVEPPEFVIGLRKFEQHVTRTAAEGRRSGPDDVDRVVYSLRKWARLALAGNPSILVALFSPIVYYEDARGTELLGLRHARDRSVSVFASKAAGPRFLGYMRAQRERFEGRRGQKKGRRPELVCAHGYDTKYAGHMLRLGMQGVEILSTGALRLPMRGDQREEIIDVRRGVPTMAEIVSRAAALEAELEAALASSPLPHNADEIGVERFLVETYREAWANMGSGAGHLYGSSWAAEWGGH